MNADVPASRVLALLAAGVAALAVGIVTLTLTLIVSIAGSDPASGLAGEASGMGSAPSQAALREIPPAYLHLYEEAAARYQLDWSILAGIGKVECDHGRDPDPSCTTEGSVNSAGAGGPMQFLQPTWARYGVDGNRDGTADRWDPADAVFSAAAYLRASGAPANLTEALLAYNHADWYVAEVERWAARYRMASGRQTGQGVDQSAAAEPDGAPVRLLAQPHAPALLVPGDRAELSEADGHVALAPSAASPVVQAMIVAGNELQDLPYGPAGHPDPRGSSQEDCSSTVNYVLYRAGVRPIEEILSENPLAQDYVRWGAPGTGRWVTIYATDVPTAHVFIVIAGLRLDTSHNGTDVGPNRGEDGPRWRLLDHIPTWAHWAVRHPPGL